MFYPVFKTMKQYQGFDTRNNQRRSTISTPQLRRNSLVTTSPLAERRNSDGIVSPLQLRRSSQNHTVSSTDDTKKETTTQAFLYVGAYLFTYGYPSIEFIFFDDQKRTYIRTCFICLCIPLQGWWNLMAFIHPRFNAIRKKNLNKSFWWVLCTVIFSSQEELDEKKRKASYAARRLESIAYARKSFNLSSTSMPKNRKNNDSVPSSPKRKKKEANLARLEAIMGGSKTLDCEQVTEMYKREKHKYQI